VKIQSCTSVRNLDSPTISYFPFSIYCNSPTDYRLSIFPSLLPISLLPIVSMPVVLSPVIYHVWGPGLAYLRAIPSKYQAYHA